MAIGDWRMAINSRADSKLRLMYVRLQTKNKINNTRTLRGNMFKSTSNPHTKFLNEHQLNE